MAYRSGTTTLQKLLHKMFFKLKQDEGEFHRYYVIAQDGLRDLNIYHQDKVKATTLSIDTTNFTADYPDDYVDYVQVVVENETKGRWWSITRDDDMVDKTISGVSGTDLGDLNHNIGYGSVGGKNKFYFKPDDEERRFLFDEAYADETVVLYYKTSGVESESYSSTTDIVVPLQVEDPLEKYIRWQICEYDGAPDNECRRREKQYDRAVNLMRTLDLPTVHEIMDVWAGASNVTGLIRD
jgi:hypothetical protein